MDSSLPRSQHPAVARVITAFHSGVCSQCQGEVAVGDAIAVLRSSRAWGHLTCIEASAQSHSPKRQRRSPPPPLLSDAQFTRQILDELNKTKDHVVSLLPGLTSSSSSSSSS
ncbi:MAG: hypothetical protein Q8P67_25760, partial [archaeon]|nr:hypothetical protein [archaeon]